MKFILGQAGTGKTYLLKESIEILEKNGVIVFCYTHSGLNNIGYKHSFTFHSYFNLDYNNNYKKLRTITEPNILIDEIGIVPIKIFKLICKFDSTHNIICYGDILQLSPIENLDIKCYPNLNINMTLTPSDVARIYVKLNQSLYVNKIYQKSEKLILQHNFRSEDYVMQVLNDALNNKIELIDNPYTLIQYGYVVISSKYKHLKYINTNYNRVYGDTIQTKIGVCSSQQEFRLCKTISKKFTNNSVVKLNGGALVSGTSHTLINTDEKQDIIPLNFITVHKSQGLEFDNVLVILDDLFDVSMLYTMITRAKKDVKFFIISSNKEKVFDELKTLNTCFYELQNIIYGV